MTALGKLETFRKVRNVMHSSVLSTLKSQTINFIGLVSLMVLGSYKILGEDPLKHDYEGINSKRAN